MLGLMAKSGYYTDSQGRYQRNDEAHWTDMFWRQRDAFNAALNVGCDPRKIAEIIFQLSTYAGMPAVNDALDVYREVLKERGEWPIK